MATHSRHLLDLARRGAEVRLREIVHEARNLVALFPHLRDSFDPDELPVQFIIAEGAGRTSVMPARRRRMSAAARRAVGRRMKKYWAEQRKSKARS